MKSRITTYFHGIMLLLALICVGEAKAADISVSQITYTKVTGATATGTAGSTGYELANLVDGDETTAWMATSDSRYVILDAQKSITLIGYSFTTGIETATNSGYNPVSWTVYGSNDTGDTKSWCEIATQTDNTSLPVANQTERKFFVEAKTRTYRYYKFEFTKQSDGANVIQLSELSLLSGATAAGYDYNSTDNLWKPVDTGTSFLNYDWYMAYKSNNVTTVVQNKDNAAAEIIHSTNQYSFTVNSQAGTNQWEAQAAIRTKLPATGGTCYTSYFTLESDKDINNVTVKIGDAKTSTNYLVQSRVNIKNGVNIIKVTNASMSAADSIELRLDFAGGAGANIVVSSIYFGTSNRDYTLNSGINQVFLKLKDAGGNTLGYLTTDFKIVATKEEAKAINLNKQSDGTIFIKSGNNVLSYNITGNMFMDDSKNYYYRGEWGTTYSDPVMQYCNAVTGGTGLALRTYPRLYGTTSEKDIATGNTVTGATKEANAATSTDGKSITGYYRRTSWRYCYFRITDKGKISFILKDNVLQDYSRPMTKTEETTCDVSPYEGYGRSFSKPLYFKVLAEDVDKDVDGNTNGSILYPITDESEAVSVEIEKVPYVDFVHTVGTAYDNTQGATPSDLTYTYDGTQYPYKTIKDDPRIENGVTIQRTHEYTHDVYALPGQVLTLTPFSDFSSSANYKEVYSRWYDYRTDLNSASLSSSGTISLTKGLIGGSTYTGSRANGTTAKYTVGSTADSDGIFGIMAIDVANSYTYSTTLLNADQTGLVVTEPTLQFRHLFVIRDGAARANTMSDKTNGPAYVSANKVDLMAPAGTPFQYRLPSNEYYSFGSTSCPTDYFYRTGESTYGTVYHYLIETWKYNTTTKTYELLGSSIADTDGGDAHKATTALERFGGIGDGTKIARSYKQQSSQDRVFYIQKPEVGKYTIKLYAIENSLDNTKKGYQQAKPIYYYGETAADENRMELMEYSLTVLAPEDGNMILEDSLSLSRYSHQRPVALDAAYGTATAVVNFDGLDAKNCYSKNNSTVDLYYKWPWKWETSSYAFGYKDRYDYNMYMVANNANQTPYCAASTGTGGQPYDRLYYDTYDSSTKKGQQGFFFYANAAGDPGRMAELNIGKNFCQGTRVYVSAWVMEMSSAAETANVVFSFRGVDSSGNETIMNSFATGYVTGGDNTYDGYKVNTSNKTSNPNNRGKWMHVYYSFMAENSSTAYDHYIITLENNCTNSNGADYAIDDIRAYVCRPSVHANQFKPVCNGSMSTDLKLSGDFESLLNTFGIDEDTEEKSNKQEFYYCFLDKQTFEDKLLELSTAKGYASYDAWTAASDAKVDEYTAAYNTAFNAALITNTYGSGTGCTANYGKMSFNRYYAGNPLYTESTYSSATIGEALRQVTGSTRYLIFPCDATDSKLYIGKVYTVAMCVDHPELPTSFDVTGKCSRTSNFSVIVSGEVKIDGTLDSEMNGASICANQTPNITINLNGIGQNGVQMKTEDAYFDWYMGPADLTSDVMAQGYTIAYNTEKGSDGVTSLKEAMQYFRDNYPKATDLSSAPKDTYTAAHKACIQEFIDADKLVLYSKSEALSTMQQFNELLDPDAVKNYYISAIPINPTPEDSTIHYCLDEAIQVVITLNTRTPRMNDGDDQGLIPYPSTFTDVPLRIGLKQLRRTIIDNLNSTTYTNSLFVPLRNITPSTTVVETLVGKADDDYIYLAASNDPNVSAGTSGAVSVTNSDLHVIGKLMAITADKNLHGQKYDPLVGTGNICKLNFIKDFQFREGYWYTLKFHFVEQYTPSAGENYDVCPGDVVITIKVVPEYQMWTGTYSRNWNDDRNWRRVTRAELFNPTVANVGNDFVTDGGTNDQTFSYAPADFTKVIIPAGTPFTPYLYDLREATNVTSVYFTGAPSKTDYINMTSPDGSLTTELAKEIGAATNLVKFDMASVDLTAGGSVACRTWYDNTCDQIHFMSGAEIMDQRYLHYNKAWCDITVATGSWQTISSPLTKIVAGDLYLPSDNASQDTPLFEDITYDTNKNDRFKPAVYQRSWNKGKATVYKLDGTTAESAVALDWSHVYNDANENYDAGVGFSIKVDASTVPGKPATAKFRLPKADTSYTYYNPGNVDGDKKTEAVIDDAKTSGVRPGNLIDINSTFSKVVGGGTNTGTKYFLIGNPLMCYLDMTEFFKENTQFATKYWLVTAEGQTSATMDVTRGTFISSDDINNNTNDANYVKPRQSFFVELTSGTETSETPKFTNAMMYYATGETTTVDPVVVTTDSAQLANDPIDTTKDVTGKTSSAKSLKRTLAKKTSTYQRKQKSEPLDVPSLYISAVTEDGRKSSAVLTDAQSANIDGAEMLLDSNLSGDLFVYAAVKGKAMSIGSISDGDTVAVAATGRNEDVDMKIKGAASFNYPLYLIDTELGTTKALVGDTVINVKTNGIRYYIVAGIHEAVQEKPVAMPHLVANKCTLTAYAPATEPINKMNVCNTSGTLVDRATDISDSYSVTLPEGIYLVEIATPTYHNTVKIYLKK